MIFGRPMMISAASTTALELPLAIDDEELTSLCSSEGARPRLKASYIAFWREATKLIQISGEILEEIQASSSGRLDSIRTDLPTWTTSSSGLSSKMIEKVTSGDFHDVLRLDAALTKWRHELPPFLERKNYQVDGANLQEEYQIPVDLFEVFQTQAKVLEVRSVPRQLFYPI